MTQDPDTQSDTGESIEEANKAMGEQLTSRRTLLGGAAAVGAAGLAGVGFGTVGAEDNSSNNSSSNGDSGNSGGDGMSDVDILNYALTLEHLEATFYQQGLEEFSADDFMNSDLACDLCEQAREELPKQIEVVGQHEAAHVDQLTSVIKNLGGTPVEAAEYDFGYKTPSEFLGVAMALENTGVAAYAGAAPDIKNDKLLAAAVSIHSVEARHAAVFNGVNMESPFPNAFDEPKTMEEVKKIAGQFIVSDN